MSRKKTSASCPCGSGNVSTQCCEAIINGSARAASAEALMRSRYTAYMLGNESYLLDSWHASTRPQSIDLEPSIQWLRLKILNRDENHVEFIATYRLHGKACKLHENSRFVFEHGKWFYVDGNTSTNL